MQNQPAQAQPGAVDVDPIIAKAEANIPDNLKPIFQKAVLSGMRIMFDRQSHQLLQDALNQPGPLATKISNGIIQLMYMLWTQSNKTLPPQIIVPVTLVLTLRAFQYLQLSHDPEATKEVLGEATAEAVQGIMDRFNAAPGAGGAPSGQPGAAPAAPAAGAGQPPSGGMLDSVGGANG